MKKIKIMSLLSAILMFVCAFLYITIHSGSDNNSKKTDHEKIKTVVATQNIKPHSILSEEMLEPKVAYKNDGVKELKIKDLIGKVCTSEIFQGEIITENRIANQDDALLGLAYSIEKGKRAATVAVDLPKGVGGNIKVGNYVDVIMTYPIGSDELSAGMVMRSGEGSKNSTVISDKFGNYFTMLVLQKIKVVALDEFYYYDTSDVPNEQSYSSVTLEATPEQINALVFCDKEDVNIRLSLRPQSDDKKVDFSKDIILE